MIDQADTTIKEWITDVVDVAISLRTPRTAGEEPRVDAYLLQLAQAPANGNPQRFQIKLRYLITTWAEEPEEAHRLLGQLAFAAMEDPRFDVELDAMPSDLWRAFDMAPRPAFYLCYIISLARRAEKAPLVREPVKVKSAPVAHVGGTLLGPDRRPLVQSRVELPRYRRRSVTDSKGRFSLGSISAQAAPLRFTVHVKGLDRTFSYEHPGLDGKDITIVLDDLEV